MNTPLVVSTAGSPRAGQPQPGAPTWRTLYLTLGAAALLIVAAFFTGGAFANRGGAPSAGPASAPASAFLSRTTSNTPYDLRFIDMMIPHHTGAIIAVQAMISTSTHPELRDLGQRIIQVQQQQIEQMRTWRQQWYPDAPPLTTATMSMGMDMMSGGTLGGWMMGSGVLTMTSTMAPYRGMMGGGMMGPTGPPAANGTNRGGSMMDGGLLSSDQAARMFLRMMIPHHQLAIDLAQDALQHAQHPDLKPLAQRIISGQSAEITEMEGYLRLWYNEASTRNLAAPMEQMMDRMGR